MKHIPVLVGPLKDLFKPTSGDRLLDATLGHGGHAAAYLEASHPDGTVVGLDADPEALAVAQENLAIFGHRVTYINANFVNIKDSIILMGGGILTGGAGTFSTKSSIPDQIHEFEDVSKSPSSGEVRFTHILFDLGIGSHQLADTKRGFSFDSPADLTMWYGPVDELPVARVTSLNWLAKKIGKYPDAIDIIAQLEEVALAEIISTYGEERYASRIARALKQGTVPQTSRQLADKIKLAVPPGYERGRINPATRTFQALRLAVNRELEVLEQALPPAIDLLAPGGILAVISFHSLEDRIVKHTFKSANHVKVLTKKPIRADQQEIKVNPRSRSAKLRAIQKE